LPSWSASKVLKIAPKERLAFNGKYEEHYRHTRAQEGKTRSTQGSSTEGAAHGRSWREQGKDQEGITRSEQAIGYFCDRSRFSSFAEALRIFVSHSIRNPNVQLERPAPILL
jgi:hypothetical protein